MCTCILIFVLSLTTYTWAESQCPDTPESLSMILRRRLFCGYDRNARPTMASYEKTTVGMHMWLKQLHFHPEVNTLELHSWTVLSWTDGRLTWDKSEYGDLDEIDVSSEQIWVPTVDTNSPTDMGSLTPRLSEVQCHLAANGNVSCVTPATNSALCDADIRRWPFDTHNCTMRVVAWSNHDLELKLKLSGLSTDEYNENRDWILLNSSVVAYGREFSTNSSTNFTVNWIIYSFVLQRHSGGHAAIVFIPSLGLAILTLVVFWMESSSERLSLICVNILCHVTYLQYLGVQLPPNGDKYPIILIFYRDSLLMVGLSLVISLLVRTMNAASSVPPPWITSLMDAVPDHVLLGGGEDEGKKWRRCSVLLDRVTFICYLITFIVLIMAYIP